MDRLVGDLLAASRIDFEAVERTPLRGVDIARRALAMAGRDRSDLRVERGEIEVVADPTLASRALAVLLDNAVRHGREPVQLEVVGDDDGVSFHVLDAGPGFADGDDEAIFQPFVGAAARCVGVRRPPRERLRARVCPEPP